MLRRSFIPAALLLISNSCAHSQAQEQGSFGPRIESAVANAPQIFNAVHNAMRQFGSSLHHNGMSFFQATIPTGTILYHGAATPDVPESLEWLAFEIEHSENFARGIWRRPPKEDEPAAFQNADQKPLRTTSHTEHVGTANLKAHSAFQQSNPWGDDDDDDDDDWVNIPGYLHVYQAARPLNVLYLDGMAAAKTNLGTNDAEDYILTGNKTRRGREDYVRVADLCAWAKKWQVDGFIRMEPGFEVAYCDFQDRALHQVSATRRKQYSYSEEGVAFDFFQWVQAASQRYHGIGGSRVIVDYSSMVSAFFYPLNLTNPNASYPELPRLLAANEDQLANIREHVERLSPKQRQKPVGGTDWQGVTDMVVARYADRLALISTVDSVIAMNRSLEHLLEAYVDHLEDGVDFADAQSKCAAHYLAGVVPKTQEEELIYAGILGTTKEICQTLFKAYKLIARNESPDESYLDEALSLVQNLMDRLRWSKWKECGGCKIDEVCFIAMWPFGNTEDHYSPSCLNASSFKHRTTYWQWEW